MTYILSDYQIGLWKLHSLKLWFVTAVSDEAAIQIQIFCKNFQSASVHDNG